MRHFLFLLILFACFEPGFAAKNYSPHPAINTTLALQPITSENSQKLTIAKTLSFKTWELVTALAWSPDQRILVAAASDKLFAFDSQTWEAIWEYQVGAYTHSLAFSPDGRYLASGSRDGSIRVWQDIQNSTPAAAALPYLEIEAHKKGVNSVVFDPSNRYLASGGNDAVARFWDLETGNKLGEMIGGTFAVPAIAFSPDGKTLAVVNGDAVRLREVGSERIIGTIQAEAPMFSIAYHPSGQWLATGSTDNRLDYWDPAQAFRTGLTSFPEPVPFSGHEGKNGTYQTLVWQVVFSPDGNLMASAGGDATVRIWDTHNQKLLTTLKAARRAVTSLAFSPDGISLAAGSLDGAITIWQIMD